VRASVPEGEWQILGPPKQVSAVVTADLKSSSFPPSPSEHASGTVAARLIPVSGTLFRLGGNVGTTYSGIPSELGKKAHIDADVAVKLEIPHFEKLTRKFEGTPWAPWAPIANLKGAVALEATGKFDPSGGRIPLQFHTALQSASQKLDIVSSGALEVAGWGGRSRTNAEVDVALQDVQLELPRLDLAAPPRLVPDPRIAPLKQRAGVTEPSFFYRVHIHTPPGHVAHILSNLARAPVPLTLDLSFANDQPVKGDIRVQKFPIQFFNRKAMIDHFDLSLRDPSSESVIGGQVKMDLVDYVFQVDASGTLGKPAFAFSSDPPLSQDQILAVLLYGQGPEQLDSEQSSTVSNTNAALSDQAIGLASFLLLGSTPIQGLTYDPSSKALQVKFKIAEGTSLTVSSSAGDTRDIGVRRRLTKNWSITTDLVTQPGEPNILSAFLEWAHRY
jgi:hypothetical protein